MNFQNLPKTLPSVKKIIHVQSRFRQFKRYIDQGKEHESKRNNNNDNDNDNNNNNNSFK